MGPIQSCTGKRSNKVDVTSEEEAEAHSKMEEETKKELVDDNIQTKPPPWMMPCTEPIVPKPFTDEVPVSPVSEAAQKKGGAAPDTGHKSTAPKPPPINAKRVQVPAGGEDYEKWKAERDKHLVDKHEKAKIRIERIIQEKKLSAQRPRTARSRDAIESTPSKD